MHSILILRFFLSLDQNNVLSTTPKNALDAKNNSVWPNEKTATTASLSNLEMQISGRVRTSTVKPSQEKNSSKESDEIVSEKEILDQISIAEDVESGNYVANDVAKELQIKEIEERIPLLSKSNTKRDGTPGNTVPNLFQKENRNGTMFKYILLFSFKL